MPRRSSFPNKPATIDVQGVLGTFRAPQANLTVEYVLTYSPLDGGETANGQLLELLVPVREAFDLDDLDFDQLLQRDLDDFRVSEEMVPYLLGKTSSDPRFFPPIVAVIVPMTGKGMAELYPPCNEDYEDDQGVQLKVFKYGDVFSVKRERQEKQEEQEEEQDAERLAQSPVDLCIHPKKAKLVVVDGQHRAMAMLATYRSALNGWNGNPFRHFYQEVTPDISELHEIHLPVCIAYFPELTNNSELIEGHQVPTERHLTIACRKLFLDVNRNARHPSQARQILLDDTDLIACFTRHLFNIVKNNTEPSALRLYHTEYDNPRDRTSIFRPFALTDVYTIYSTIRSVLLLDDERVRQPMASPSSGRHPQNNFRLQRELDLENMLTEADKERLGIEIVDIKQNDYPQKAEGRLRKCFEATWGQVVVTSLEKLYPFSAHIEAVETVLKEHDPYTGVNHIAYTALVEGQGLRYTLHQQQQRNKELRQDGEESEAEKAWRGLQRMEEDFEKCRAKLYLKLSCDPTDEQIKTVNRIFECFRSSAFQNGLFMAFACLKARMGIGGQQEFSLEVDKWITHINEKFENTEGIRTVLFDYSEPKSLRYIYKPSGGLIPSDWIFFRYLMFELLSVETGEESSISNPAKLGWREKLYTTLYNRKKKELRFTDEEANSHDHLDRMSFRDIVDAFKSSLDIDEEEIKSDLSDRRESARPPISEIEDEEVVADL